MIHTKSQTQTVNRRTRILCKVSESECPPLALYIRLRVTRRVNPFARRGWGGGPDCGHTDDILIPLLMLICDNQHWSIYISYRADLWQSIVLYLLAQTEALTPNMQHLGLDLVYYALLRLDPSCCFKWILRASARGDAKLQCLHLFGFSPLCVVKCVLNLCA